MRCKLCTYIYIYICVSIPRKWRSSKAWRRSKDA